MAGYKALKITGMSSGLVQEREEFLLPDDAYPSLQNAYVWRERILRKKGYQLLGRLQRNIGTTDGAGNFSVAITPNPLTTSATAYFEIGTDKFQDPGGPSPVNLITNGAGSGTLNRNTGVVTITGSIINTAVQYFPGLPVMGIRIRELANSANDQTIFFDQVYAYVYSGVSGKFQEFIPGVTWNAHGGSVAAIDFFWSTNYWVSDSTVFPNFGSDQKKLFWVTNNTGSFGNTSDPIRITDGISWKDFVPPDYGQIDGGNPGPPVVAPAFLLNCLSFLPFRGRMVAFNTWEGPDKGNAKNYSNRIRWSTIGNPFIRYTAGPPAAGSWRDDIRGQGGFLDIPTSEDIISVGFVRDNLVIYCERSTWQLRYTGRSIAPFQIERVNSELGCEGPFSAVQFDTSLVGIGDKGIVECDSYKSERIDIKIPDFVFQFNNTNNGVFRVHGIRDFPNRLAFWTIPLATSYDPRTVSVGSAIFPNNRLVYNYENYSWALFNDTLTCLGTFQMPNSRTWLNTPIPWLQLPFTWLDQQSEEAAIVGGNQQGFIEQLDVLTVNDVSLFISNISANVNGNVQFTVPNHNLTTETVIGVKGIPAGKPYVSLNGGVFGIGIIDASTFDIYTYDAASGMFSTPVVAEVGTYTGGGLINIRENFNITSKKFNFLDEGNAIQLGFLDILMAATEPTTPGAISLNIYLEYDNANASNRYPSNQIYGTPNASDAFFNSVIPTCTSDLNKILGSKFWQRVFCPTRANFLTIQYTFSNAQMAGVEQTLEVQIDAQVLYIRKGGRMTNI